MVTNLLLLSSLTFLILFYTYWKKVTKMVTTLQATRYFPTVVNMIYIFKYCKTQIYRNKSNLISFSNKTSYNFVTSEHWLLINDEIKLFKASQIIRVMWLLINPQILKRSTILICVCIHIYMYTYIHTLRVKLILDF